MILALVTSPDRAAERPTEIAGHPCPLAPSELIAESELQDSRIARGLDLAEIAVVERRHGRPKIHLVEGVEEFRPELQGAQPVGNWEPFDK